MGAIASISLLVGGIGIMNIMLVTVTERTREIGIRKALGASSRDIRRQFFAEALTLSVLGGIAGLLVGFALSGLVQAVSPLPARVTTWSIGIALLLGIVVGGWTLTKETWYRITQSNRALGAGGRRSKSN